MFLLLCIFLLFSLLFCIFCFFLQRNIPSLLPSCCCHVLRTWFRITQLFCAFGTSNTVNSYLSLQVSYWMPSLLSAESDEVEGGSCLCGQPHLNPVHGSLQKSREMLLLFLHDAAQQITSTSMDTQVSFVYFYLPSFFNMAVGTRP